MSLVEDLGSNILQFITIASTGNAQDFGETFTGGYSRAKGVSSATRGVCMGGVQPTRRSNIKHFLLHHLHQQVMV